MKYKIMLLTSLAAMSLVACQNEEVKTQEDVHTNHKEHTHSSVKENTVEESKEIEVEVKEQKPAEVESEESEENHSHQEDNTLALKAEDVIVSYFNAVSFGDSETLEKLYPSAVEENIQLVKLHQNSKVITEIVGMKKLSLSDAKANYQVDVKLYTKEEDNLFTNNKTTFTIEIDMTKGIVNTKEVTHTDFLE